MLRNFFNKSLQDGSTPQARVASDERVYAIGDVHGRQDLLNAILERISRDIARFSDARRPRIIFMGDYVDRGDHSSDVLDTLSGFAAAREVIAKETGVQMDFLAGNHEVAMLNFLEYPLKGRAWLNWGGLQTLASFGISPVPTRISDQDLVKIHTEFAIAAEPFVTFLRSLSRLVVSGSVVFVHAGFDPTLPLDQQPEEATLWGNAPSGQKLGAPGYRMVHGHFANYEPISRPHRICVDTGAYYSGRLTAARLDDGEAFLFADGVDLLDTPGIPPQTMAR